MMKIGVRQVMAAYDAHMARARRDFLAERQRLMLAEMAPMSPDEQLTRAISLMKLALRR